jgi:hypothetical protein
MTYEGFQLAVVREKISLKIARSVCLIFMA